MHDQAEDNDDAEPLYGPAFSSSFSVNKTTNHHYHPKPLYGAAGADSFSKSFSKSKPPPSPVLGAQRRADLSVSDEDKKQIVAKAAADLSALDDRLKDGKISR